MSATIDDRYFEWLYSRFQAVRNRDPARSYWNLARQLYSTEFVWIVANDGNRVEDGLILRQDFMNEQGSAGVTNEWLDLGCSMLEMLLALALRASYQVEKEPADWFEIFLKNLGLIKFTDDRYNAEIEKQVSQILENFIYRNYRVNGRGGLFPLKHPERAPDRDQSKVELWYQMMAYILENE